MEKDKIRVYNNIDESPYFYEYKEYKFYFSSEFYQRNFRMRLESYVKEETYKLKNRYKILNTKFLKDLEEILYISLYKRIEKRGFRIYKYDIKIKEM